MKKASVSAIALCLALLAGCAATAGTAGTPSPQPPERESPASDLPGTEMWQMTCRIVDGAESGALMLAEGEDGPYGGTGIYTLAVGETPVWIDGEEKTAADLKDGMLVEVCWNGLVAESYPAQLGEIYSLRAESRDTDDRCGLYLQVLEDLWEVDPGLNTSMEELGVDFSELTDLSTSEKAALTWAFGNAHGLMPITGTLEEIWEAGYLTPMTEPAEGYEDSVALYGWEGGCLFSLSGSADTAFRAEKWASGLGAYVFSDCTAKMGADGSWSYTVGSQAIS